MYNPYNYSNNGINWVNGIEGAKAYQLMPNSNVMLLDSENEGIFYIKVSDNVGMCTVRSFKYEEVSKNIDTKNDYVSKDELKAEIEKLRKELKNVKQSVQTTQQQLEL